MPRAGIVDEIRRGTRPQGAEIRPDDIGRRIGALGEGFGSALPGDVGKRVWLRDYGTVMENAEQRDARIAGSP